MSSSTSNIDLGNLLISDYSKLTQENSSELTETQIQSHTKSNLINFFSTLFSELKSQQQENGIDYSISLNELTLPKPILILPRSLAIPKPKPLTKWEKYFQKSINLEKGENPSYIKEKAAEYDELQASSASAAARGYVDTIIEPSDTRKYVIGALEMLYGKEEAAPDRKHGTI